MKRNDILLILVPTFIFVFAWMGFSIYHGFINSTISESLNTQILPISPGFDTKTVSALKNRQHAEPIYEINSTDVSSGTEDTQNQTASSSAKSTAPVIDNSSSSQSTTGGKLTQ